MFKWCFANSIFTNFTHKKCIFFVNNKKKQK